LEDLQGNDDDSDNNEHDFHWSHGTEGVCERVQGGLALELLGAFRCLPISWALIGVYRGGCFEAGA